MSFIAQPSWWTVIKNLLSLSTWEWRTLWRRRAPRKKMGYLPRSWTRNRAPTRTSTPCPWRSWLRSWTPTSRLGWCSLRPRRGWKGMAPTPWPRLQRRQSGWSESLITFSKVDWWLLRFLKVMFGGFAALLWAAAILCFVATAIQAAEDGDEMVEWASPWSFQ